MKYKINTVIFVLGGLILAGVAVRDLLRYHTLHHPWWWLLIVVQWLVIGYASSLFWTAQRKQRAIESSKLHVTPQGRVE